MSEVMQDTARAPITHNLKINRAPYDDLVSGAKTSEVRNCSDRDFRVGDSVELFMTETAEGFATESIVRKISHIQRGYGLPDGLCVLSYESALRQQLADVSNERDGLRALNDKVKAHVSRLCKVAGSQPSIATGYMRDVLELFNHQCATATYDGFQLRNEKSAKPPKGTRPDWMVEAQGGGFQQIARVDRTDWRHVEKWRIADAAPATDEQVKP